MARAILLSQDARSVVVLVRGEARLSGDVGVWRWCHLHAILYHILHLTAHEGVAVTAAAGGVSTGWTRKLRKSVVIRDLGGSSEVCFLDWNQVVCINPQ